MSGICGIIRFDDENVKKEDIKKMIDSMSNCGNDKIDLYVKGNMGFGHTMLWTTAESLHESQPLQNDDNTVILTADARIDNREELINILNLEQKQLSIITDSDLILFAYEKWGEKCVDRLIGYFAFAIWYTKIEKIFIYRDRLGIRNCFYYQTDSFLIFASDISAILTFSEYSPKPNIDAMKSLLYDYTVGIGSTMYENIKSLPPGYFMCSYKMNSIVKQYWYPEKIIVNKSLSIGKASQKFLKLFEDAVHCRLRSAYPVACQLSGGLDSSSVVSIALKEKDMQDIHVFAQHYGNYTCDESKYIKSVIKKLSITYKYNRIDKLDYKNKYTLDLSYSVNPHWPMYNTFTNFLPMYEEMKQKGIRVVLTGQGGDHIVTGNTTMLVDFFQSFQWIKFMQQVKYTKSSWGAIKKYIILPLLSTHQKENLKKMICYFRKEKTNNTLDHYPFKDVNYDNLKDNGKAFYEDLYDVTGAIHTTWCDSNSFQQMGKYNLEVRHPFFDSRLVEFALSLPPEYKFSKNIIKVVLRESMKDILPEEVRIRNSKAEFSEVILDQINAIDLEVIVNDSYLENLNIISKEEILKIMNDFKKMKKIDPNKVSKLWKMINLEYWLIRYNREN